MRLAAQWRAMFAVAAVLALVVAGCGGDDSSSEKPAQSNNAAPKEAKKGGDLTVMYAGDVDNIDPGITYYQYGFNVAYATQRPLYSFKPDDAINPEPDLAEGPPEIAPDGKSLTVKIRTGVKFSPPVNREVTSADVKYGLERGFLKTVNGPYVGAYMSDIEGVKAYQDGKAKEISGITTPDDQTIKFTLARPRAAIVAGALALPASAPVPKDYAQKYDEAAGTSKYGNYQVFTGPYMIQNDASGKLTGYTPGSLIKLVRNPNWDASTDYKPAYADSITIKEGNDADVASRQILEGDNMISGDFQLPGPGAREGVAGRPEGSAGPDAADRALPLHRAQQHDEAVRRPERPQGHLRRDGPRRAAQGVRRPARRQDPDALDPARAAGLR